MKTLLWREYGFNRQLLIAGAAILLFPYVITLIVFLWPTKSIITPHEVTEGFAVAAICSYAASQLTVALLGGYAIAGERADRSAEFLAYLPVSRARRLASKLILAAVVTAFIWAINLAVLWGLMHWLPWRISVPDDFFTPKYTALTGLVMFGVSWLMSSTQASPSIAVIGGIATPALVMIGLMIAIETFETQNKVDLNEDAIMATWYTGISLALGILGFAVGTWYFLKRVEP
jgi:ABC-type transport system involved in multi-copper enzyme maturation permease subunit